MLPFLISSKKGRIILLLVGDIEDGGLKALHVDYKIETQPILLHEMGM